MLINHEHDGETTVYLRNICRQPRWFWVKTWWVDEYMRFEPGLASRFTTTVVRIPYGLGFHLCCDVNVWTGSEWRKTDPEFYIIEPPMWWYRDD